MISLRFLPVLLLLPGLAGPLDILASSLDIRSREAVLQPYRAIYETQSGKRKAKMAVSLSRESEQVYIHNMEIKIFIIGTVRVTTMMHLNDSGLYPFVSSGGLGNRIESFEWQDGALTYTDRKGKQRTLEAEGGEHNEHSIQYDIALQLAEIGMDNREDLLSWEKVYRMSTDKAASWSSILLEAEDIVSVPTPLGEMECVKVSGTSADEKYRFEFYLAPEKNWLMVQYQREGENIKKFRSMRLKSIKSDIAAGGD